MLHINYQGTMNAQLSGGSIVSPPTIQASYLKVNQGEVTRRSRLMRMSCHDSTSQKENSSKQHPRYRRNDKEIKIDENVIRGHGMTLLPKRKILPRYPSR